MIVSRLNKKSKSKIVKAITSFYKKEINRISSFSGRNNVGGKIRQAMGDLGETLCTLSWSLIAELYKDIEKPIAPKKGEDDKIRCINKKGHEYFAHVDRHCYINKNFVLAIEAKSYLDACYCARASSDFRLLKMYFNKGLLCIVISIEDAIKESSKNFIEDEEWVDKIFILTDGKRSSSRPIWKKEFRKKLNPKKVELLIKFLDRLFTSNISTRRTH